LARGCKKVSTEEGPEGRKMLKKKWIERRNLGRRMKETKGKGWT